MLDDTLVLWGGEFGRTNYSQGKLTATDYGRDHHPRCFTAWAAGGGIKAGHHIWSDRSVRIQRRLGRRSRPRFPCHGSASSRH